MSALLNLEPVMHFEPDTEWCADAGGVMELSRWWSGAKPPEVVQQRIPPRMGRRMGANPSPAPRRGAISLRRGSGGSRSLRSLHHRLMSNVPPGQTLPTALKVHDTL